ncbi:cyclic nucleotide-gated channel 6 [Rhynchospora pubera]|uniref:Cyclic nucleotide-gated channel 6 n=1 Tax=Rhynchospora pubera TaxID=906938 RepID=A0AAV8HFK5_9POAL|nr:cyclic nucleotide-gated channel 6 [Rhynchospora pubera]
MSRFNGDKFGSRRFNGEMSFTKQRTVRFYDERQRPTIPTTQVSRPGAPIGINPIIYKGQPDYLPLHKRIFDPTSDFILGWNRVFLFCCICALFIDPLYFYVPTISYNVNGGATSCVESDTQLSVALTCLRSLSDLLYVIHIIIKFRTAYIDPSSTLRVFGRGELVRDPKEISMRYLKSDFAIDVAAALPLPQIVIWLIIPAIKYSTSEHNNNIVALIVLLQYIPRLYLIFPLSYEIVKATGVVAKTAWMGAAYNLVLYLIASHVLGSLWYLLTVDRQTTCWKETCRGEQDQNCQIKYLDCSFSEQDKDYMDWANRTQVFTNCNVTNQNSNFSFGMFGPALTNESPAKGFIVKYFYSFWWGLQNLSCYGQTLTVSTYIGETVYAIFLAVVGLVLFAHLIGNVQTYLQSITVRVEEWRLKQRDTEEWMKHRQLPQELRDRVRRFIQYKWLATRGVDEESILQSLPADLRRDIKRHLCLDLVRRVPLFAQMDDQLLNAICERLVSSLSTKGTYVVREGDPVTEMLFIIRGELESSTTNGGRTGFFNSTILKPGDFCGEELLGWALVSKSTINLPSSTRTVKALVEVEAFALRAEDLKFVANQFRRLHSKKLQHTFRFYSHHWRTWATCFIQAAWRRYKRRKMAKDLSMRESLSFNSVRSEEEEEEEEENVGSSQGKQNFQNLGVKIMAAVRKGGELRKLQKPDEPDFSADGFE